MNTLEIKNPSIPCSFRLDDEVAVQFLIGAFNQCGRWWFANYNKISREEMQKRFYKIADAYMDALKNC